MRKYFVGILLGFFLHKGLSSYYSYNYWTAQADCRNSGTEQSQCINKQLGINSLLVPILSYPAYIFKQWAVRYP